MITKTFSNIIEIIKFNLCYIILFLFFALVTDFFKNINTLLNNNYNNRMLNTYNYCGGISYGYIKKIKNNYLLYNTKINIINFSLDPSSIDLFLDIQPDTENDNLILLNYKKDNKQQLKNKKINLLDYSLKDKEDNCYYYQKIK